MRTEFSTSTVPLSRFLLVLVAVGALADCSPAPSPGPASPAPAAEAESAVANAALCPLPEPVPEPTVVSLRCWVSSALSAALIEAGGQTILVDPGPGLRERLLEAGSFELITGIDHVLVTHLHYDHTVSLPDLWLTGWLYGRRTPLIVEGPVGTKAMMEHLEQAFTWDTAYRKAVGVPAAGVAIEARDVGPGVVFERDGLVVTAFEVEHMPIDVPISPEIGLTSMRATRAWINCCSVKSGRCSARKSAASPAR